tara:strand:- start:184 stop:1185 length:1002 start_codon:yes stop_codon:yes gene_type:complete
MNCDLNNMINGGKIHQTVNNHIKNIIKPNISLIDLANNIENKIKDLTNYKSTIPLNSGIAFPTGLSINNCVAHWTPKINNTKILLEDDVIKIDYGIHINGSIIDSAFTHTFNSKYDKLLESSRTSTDIAIKLCRPDMLLGEIGKEIEENMCSYEIELDNKIYNIKPVKSLCGHLINKYEIHGDKIIPNIYLKDYNKRITSNEFYAVETFATTGTGETYEDINDCSHYMINYTNNFKKCDIPNNSQNMYKFIIKYFNTLAFCDRWIIGKSLKKNKNNEILEDKNLNKYLNNLHKTKIVNLYPPIYDTDRKSYSAQFEETIYVDELKTVILSNSN